MNKAMATATASMCSFSRLKLSTLPALLTDGLGEVAMVVVLNGRYYPLVWQAPPQ